MNIVHSGDHVVCVIPIGHSNAEVQRVFQESLKTVPGFLEKGSDVQFTLTWLNLGAPDSSPQVLFIVRK